MNRRLTIGLGMALVAVGAGSVVLYFRNRDKVFSREVRAVLDTPDRFEFLTIDPSYENFDPKRAGTMHGYAILGRTVITDAVVQKRLVGELYDMVNPGGPANACMFEPRHAIRATRGGQVVDVVVCFHCGDIEVFAGDTMISGAPIDGSAKADFEAVAKEAGLKVAP